MTVTPDDIRAAVASGTITEGQAVGILALAEARQGYRTQASDIDEPFELFRGFNEIFVVVGLTILFSGAFGLAVAMASASSAIVFTVFMALLLVGLYFLSRYFTERRRMVAPSIALTLMVTGTAIGFGGGVAAMFENNAYDWWLNPSKTLLPLAIGLAILGYFWFRFRVPFAVACLALGVYIFCFVGLVARGTPLRSIEDIFLLSGEGPFALLTIILGVIGFAIAMAFDLSDPHRVTRRSAQAFWLHIISAMAIINPVAASLLQAEVNGAYAGLAVFLVFMAALAIIIDRRSFLLSALTYMVTLVFIVVRDETGVFFVFFWIGAVLVALGAFWEKWRQSLLNVLPDFPGKDRLPPWRIAK